MGDFLSRIQPAEVETLSNKCVMQVAAATWHSAAVVLDPPMQKSGWVYTWGSGYHGQLAQGKVQVLLKPTVVQSLLGRNLSAKSICLGSHHSAMIAMDGEMYTWGSNLNGCLGHDIKEKFVEHTPEPGHVSGFGAIVERVGRGMVRSYACGREFTIVATYPYQGPSEDVARKLMEEEAIRLDMLALEEEQERTIATKSQQQGDETVDGDTVASGNDDPTKPKGPSGLLDKNMEPQKTRL